MGVSYKFNFNLKCTIHDVNFVRFGDETSRTHGCPICVAKIRQQVADAIEAGRGNKPLFHGLKKHGGNQNAPGS